MRPINSTFLMCFCAICVFTGHPIAGLVLFVILIFQPTHKTPDDREYKDEEP